MRPIYKVDCGTPTNTQPKIHTFHRHRQEHKEEETDTEWKLNSVRTLINAFEQKGKTSSRTNLNKIKSKSFANLLRDKIEIRKPEPHVVSLESKAKEVISKFESTCNSKYRHRDIASLELDVIKTNALALHTKISNFVGNDNTECMTYQNQIIGLLTKIGALDSNGNQFLKQEKQTCLKIVQNCNIILKGKIQNLENKQNKIEPVQAIKEYIPTRETHEQECGSKVQHLKNIFERKKDDPTNSNSMNKTSGGRYSLNFTKSYTPYGEYHQNKSNNKEDNRKILEMSRSCEDVSKTGIRRLLEVLQNAQSKKLTRSKSEFHIDIAQNKAESKEMLCDGENQGSIVSLNGTVSNLATSDKEEEDVSLVSIKHSNEEDHGDRKWMNVVVDSQNFEYVAVEIRGSDKYSGSDDDSDNENRRSSGFYSLVSDAVEDQEQTDEEREVKINRNNLFVEKSSDDDESSDKSYFTVKSRNDSSPRDQDLLSGSNSPNCGEEGSFISNVLVDYNDTGFKKCYSGVSYTNAEKAVQIH